MTTLTIEEQQKIADWLEEHPVLSVGVGDVESACSIAAINLALSGRLTDEVPECMSPVVGRWIICVQDAMPSEIRNSAEWRALLPLAAGTGRDHESERLSIVLDWMWGTVLPSMQSAADSRGFGAEWSAMLVQRSVEAAAATSAAAGVTWAALAAAAASSAGAKAALAAAYVAEAAGEETWRTFDPIGVLRRLIAVGEPKN